MAKLSDVFLKLLGDAASGVYSMTPPGMMADYKERAAKENAMEQQKADSQRLTSLAHASNFYDFQPPQSSTPTATAGINGVVSAPPVQAPTQGMPVPGMSGYTMRPKDQTSSFVPVNIDEAGNPTFGTIVKVPKGAKPVIGRAKDQTSSFVPVNIDEAGNSTFGAPVNVPRGAKPVIGRALLPTAATRSTSEFAETLLPHIDEMRNLIKEADKKGYIGPAAGRVYGQFMAGKVGSTGNADADELLGQLRATDSLMKSGAMKVHFGSRGGGQMYDHFSDLLNSGKQSAAMLNGSLNGFQSFMQGYADAVKPGGQKRRGYSRDLGGSSGGSERDKFIQGAIGKGYSQMEAEGLATQNGLQ